MKKLLLISIFFILYYASHSQVIINRYTKPKVSSKGIYGKSDSVKQVVIPEINIKNVITKWENEKSPFKFAEPVLIDISPFQQGFWERINNYSINRIKITAKNANSIAVYFDKLHLSENAELFIYNSEGTIITGPITKKENIILHKG